MLNIDVAISNRPKSSNLDTVPLKSTGGGIFPSVFGNKKHNEYFDRL